MARVTPSSHMHRARCRRLCDQAVTESLAGLSGAKPPVGYRAETSQFSSPHWQAELALYVRVLAAGLSVAITETSMAQPDGLCLAGMRDVGDDGRMLRDADGRRRIAIRADGQHLDGAFCLAYDEGRIAAGVHRSVVALRLLGAELALRSLPLAPAEALDPGHADARRGRRPLRLGGGRPDRAAAARGRLRRTHEAGPARRGRGRHREVRPSRDRRPVACLGDRRADRRTRPSAPAGRPAGRRASGLDPARPLPRPAGGVPRGVRRRQRGRRDPKGFGSLNR